MLSTLGRCCVVALLTMFFVGTGETVGQETNRGSFTPGPLLKSMLKGDLREVDEIIFAVRVPGRDHWYANFGYYSCDFDARPVARAFGMYPDGVSLRAYDDGGRLCRLNLRTGKLRTLLDDPAGGVRDPQMHYDGKKILFSYRRGGSPSYRLYEINIDGTGLTQLTPDDGPDDDIEPVYLPDGGIMFVSSRCRRFVNCWFTRVGTLHRCDADGSNIRIVSSNNEHDNTPWVLPDGRILYMRWEYVDRSQADYHHLWTINPDGSGQMTYYGNQFVGTEMLQPADKPPAVSHAETADNNPCCTAIQSARNIFPGTHTATGLHMCLTADGRGDRCHHRPVDRVAGPGGVEVDDGDLADWGDMREDSFPIHQLLDHTVPDFHQSWKQKDRDRG